MSTTWTCAECGYDIHMSYNECWICHNDLTADSSSVFFADGATAQAPAAAAAAAAQAPGWAQSPTGATAAATPALTGATIE